MSTVARASAGAADIGELSVGEREARLGTLLLWAPCPADCGHGHDASDADSPAAGPGQHRWKGSATLSAGCPWAGEAGQHVARLSRVLHVVVTLVTVYRVDGRDGLVGAVAFCAGDRGLDLVRWSRDRSRSPKCRAALRWLARHLLRPWPAPAEWQWVPAVRSCGVFGCRSCDARAIGDDEACSQFRLGRVMRSIPSRVDAFLARQEREAALLVERLAKCPPPPGSLLALPVEVLSRALALLDSTTSCSLSHTCRYMQHLGASIAPGLRLQLNEHQVCALQWMLQRERHAPAARDTLGECQRYLWEDPLSSPLGERLFYNWLHDTVDDRQRFYYDARGGLFCDEPGLGKTVTALALILVTKDTLPAWPVPAEQVCYRGINWYDYCRFMKRFVRRFLEEQEVVAQHILERARPSGKAPGFLAILQAIRGDLASVEERFSEECRLASAECWTQMRQRVLQYRSRYSTLLMLCSPASAERDLQSSLLSDRPFADGAYDAGLWPLAQPRPFYVVSPTCAREQWESCGLTASARRDVTDGVGINTATEAVLGTPTKASESRRQTWTDDASQFTASPPVKRPRRALAASSPSTSRSLASNASSIATENVFRHEVRYCSAATLVILPDNLITHWRQQIEQHVEPRVQLRCTVFRRRPRCAWEMAFHYDIVLLSLQVLRQCHADIMSGRCLLNRIHWLRIIIDEGHTIGSLSVTNVQQACQALSAERRWIMTGTPTPSRATSASELQHLQPLLTFLHLEPFASTRRAFLQCVQRPVERRLGEEGLHALRQTLQHMMMRSSKEEVASIPRLIVHDDVVDFSEEEAAAYNELVSVVHRNLLLADFFDETHRESLLHPGNRGLAQAALRNLRLACCVTGHIRLEVVEEDLHELLRALAAFAARSGNENRTTPGAPDASTRGTEARLRLIEEAMRAPAAASDHACERCGRRGAFMPLVTPCVHVLCTDCTAASRYACPVCSHRYTLGRRNEPVDLIEIQPGYTQHAWHPSWDKRMTTKVAYLLQLLERWATQPTADDEEDEACSGLGGPWQRPKVIVYSNFAHHFDVLYYHLFERGYNLELVSARASREENERRMESFRSDADKWILLMDDRGALGHDLSCVSRVVIMEPVWDAAHETQIISRAHRMGARRPVVVHRLLMRGSIEVEMMRTVNDGPESVALDVEEETAVGDRRLDAHSSNRDREERRRRNRVLRNLHFVGGRQAARREGESVAEDK
ncbi:hypothetical protein CDCA_CDCA07G2111 [Cyanidium caldarium]|uniref:Uncharacterized protein n=1 Tax=Cyanidium caldarium TaxID=2771 RepID=A0AAV9IVH2_CYACA|nr:hypothetical protein CDCA_CDCA07G2111 [Cyanidium caldarium]